MTITKVTKRFRFSRHMRWLRFVTATAGCGSEDLAQTRLERALVDTVRVLPEHVEGEPLRDLDLRVAADLARVAEVRVPGLVVAHGPPEHVGRHGGEALRRGARRP